MPGKLRTLSGHDVVRILARFGFQQVEQRGSHVKLRRVNADGQKQTLHLPLHRSLRPGTQRSIFRQACQYLPTVELRPHFFAE